MSTQPIITTPGKYRTRSGEVAEVDEIGDQLAVGSLCGMNGGWSVLDGADTSGIPEFDITAKIDGGAE